MAESGVPGFDVTTWQGLVAPAGLPDPILTRLNVGVALLLKKPATIDKATIDKLRGFGNKPAPTNPEDFKKRLVADIATWTMLADEIHFEKI